MKHCAMILSWHNPRLSILAANSVLHGADVILVEAEAREEDLRKIRKAFTIKWGKNPRVIIVPLKENRFTAWGMNQGIIEAVRRKYDYITIMNNDVTVDEGYFKEVEKCGYAIVQPKTFFGFTDIIYSAGIMKNILGFPCLYGYGKPNGKEFDEPRWSVFTSFVAMTAKREVFEKVGLIDEDFQMYYDDVDWGVRAVKAGYDIFYNPKAIARHHTLSNVGQTHGKQMSRTIKYSERNMLLLAKKNGYLTWGYVLKDMIHVVKQCVCNPRAIPATVDGLLWFWGGKQ
jgi:GT2 family glycosyltransferase